MNPPLIQKLSIDPEEMFNAPLPKFKFNPFGGLDSLEILETIVPKYDLFMLVDQIRQNGPMAYQLIGKKGRGKTTHFRVLQQFFPEATVLDPQGPIKYDAGIPGPVLFIDGIYHLNMWERLKLFRRKDLTLIFTTHANRAPELKLAGKPFQTLPFKGITPLELNEIIVKRMRHALWETGEHPVMETAALNGLIRHFGDNFRGILNHLYQTFKTIQ